MKSSTLARASPDSSSPPPAWWFLQLMWSPDSNASQALHSMPVLDSAPKLNSSRSFENSMGTRGAFALRASPELRVGWSQGSLSERAW